MAGQVEGIATKKEELAKVVAALEDWLKESKSKIEEFELRATREREASKELEEGLLKKEETTSREHHTGTQQRWTKESR